MRKLSLDWADTVPFYQMWVGWVQEENQKVEGYSSLSTTADQTSVLDIKDAPCGVCW